MRFIEFSCKQAEPIQLFRSVAASSILLADGNGEVHVHCVYIGAGGIIGEHPTGLGQLFLVMEGEGWAAGADGKLLTLRAGQGVCFERGEIHTKGSDSGLTALMVQVTHLEPRASF